MAQFGQGQFGQERFGRVNVLGGRADAPALAALDLARRAALGATLSAGAAAGIAFTITTPLAPAPPRALRVLRGATLS
ncbi:MAG: hypothetical protein K6U89_19835 [Chloroflexi bacterium]|nr:hypothetical protein [Chloroflexota bacterium]